MIDFIWPYQITNCIQIHVCHYQLCTHPPIKCSDLLLEHRTAHQNQRQLPRCLSTAEARRQHGEDSSTSIALRSALFLDCDVAVVTVIVTRSLLLITAQILLRLLIVCLRLDTGRLLALRLELLRGQRQGAAQGIKCKMAVPWHTSQTARRYTRSPYYLTSPPPVSGS